jgi:Lon protease-like protein
MFPCTVQSLHVFELRYRTMVRDALSAGRAMVLALLVPGWEPEYHASPEFHPLACLTRISEVEWLPNDRYRLTLQGLSRVRLGRPVREYPYRACRVELLPQEPITEDDPLVEVQKLSLRETHERFLAAARPEAPAKVETASTYEEQVNGLCANGPATPAEKLQLLAMDSLIQRGERVRTLTENWLQNAMRPTAQHEGGLWN